MEDRCIFHIDCNSFFASVSLLYKPWLRHLPVVVGGDEEARHGIVLAKNQHAKKYKIPTGAALWEARQLCPDIVVIPPDYEKYDQHSRDIKEYLAQYTPQLESFGSDECWIDVTASQHLFGGYRALAKRILEDMIRLFGITVSIGVSWNKIYAKLGSDLKKPNAATYITRSNPHDTRWQRILYPLPAEEMIYVGHATKRKLNNKGVYTLGDMANIGEEYLVEWFGKIGTDLYRFASGQDETPVMNIGYESPVKSVGNSCTTPRDLRRREEIYQTITELCEETCRRMRAGHFMATTVSVSCRKQQGSELPGFMKQRKLDIPINSTIDFARECCQLISELVLPGEAVRSVGVRGSGLVPDDTPYQVQLGVDANRQVLHQRLDKARDAINRRFGKTCVVQGRAMQEAGLLGLGTKISQEFAPVSYYR